jgi:hypothetical protein
MHKLIASILALGLLLTACGSDGSDSDGSDSGSASPTSVLVKPADGGRTIPAHVGDRVVLDLGPPQNAIWILNAYPRDVLALASSRPNLGRFEFVASARGTGQIVVVMKLNEPGGSEDVGNDLPLRPFRVTVDVS